MKDRITELCILENVFIVNLQILQKIAFMKTAKVLRIMKSLSKLELLL